MITNARLVQDEAFEIEGLKLYGSPWTPRFHSRYWKFHKERGYDIWQKWKNIPSGLDVLITHGPPQGILDFVGSQHAGNGIIIGGEHTGDEMLYREVVLRAKPKIHVFGHIHPGYGENSYGGIHFYNAAQCGDDYQIRNEPWVIDYGKAVEQHQAQEVEQSDRRERDGARAARDAEADAIGAEQAA